MIAKLVAAAADQFQSMLNLNVNNSFSRILQYSNGISLSYKRMKWIKRKNDTKRFSSKSAQMYWNGILIIGNEMNSNEMLNYAMEQIDVKWTLQPFCTRKHLFKF